MLLIFFITTSYKLPPLPIAISGSYYQSICFHVLLLYSHSTNFGLCTEFTKLLNPSTDMIYLLNRWHSDLFCVLLLFLVESIRSLSCRKSSCFFGSALGGDFLLLHLANWIFWFNKIQPGIKKRNISGLFSSFLFLSLVHQHGHGPNPDNFPQIQGHVL